MTASKAIAKSRVIIFDLFHTLVSVRSDGTAGRSTSEALGIPKAVWNNLLWESSDHRSRHRSENDRWIIRQLAHQHDPSISESRIEAAAHSRAARFRECLMYPLRERVDVLARLVGRGHKLVLLSNADSMECRAWGESPLAAHFQAALFSCDTGYIKPEAKAYEAALIVSPAEAAEAVFVGDGGSQEFQGANTCGIVTIMTTEIVKESYPDLISQRKVDADYVIESLHELL